MLPEDFSAIKLKLASPEEILSWSKGEVTKPETINYRTQRPEKDGLFSERIFGPTKDYQCYCGKYKNIRYKGIVCDKCGVEVTRASVRRERMGHIQLACPVAHIWYLKHIPSPIALFLGVNQQQLERVVYYTAYIITKINEDERKKVLEELKSEYESKKKNTPKDKLNVLETLYKHHVDEIQSLYPLKIISEVEYFNLSKKFGHVFEAGIGSEPIVNLLKSIDLKKKEKELIKEFKNKKSDKKKILLQLKLIKSFIKNNLRPEWMFLTVIPVLPPDLRPMVALDGGRYATSDLNDLYRRVINRNNRLKKLIELNAPEVIIRNEKRMLQEAVDALIDNSARKTQIQSSAQKRPLKSLSDILQGKQGRFRQNLLGKRVDYSGRSVIVVGPELRHFECGLPKVMALELFRPFVVNKLLERGVVFNIRSANRLIDQGPAEVWAILEEVIQNRYVLLNRAPTLHRLGIQAFKPVLIEDLALRIPPMVCTAFNADFDGDQMAVHLPLTEEAQKEAREIMLSSSNFLKPANGEPIVNPTKDIILGCYYLTKTFSNLKGEGKVFANPEEVILAYHYKIIDLKAKIKIRPYKEFYFKKEGDVLVHKNILEKEKRPDGRKLDEIRPLYCAVGILPRVHGSGLFIRGTTQALSTVTLAAPSHGLTVETMEESDIKRFIHHYNFPPYSVGEVSSMRSPGRREIGHGALAEKSLLPIIPKKEDFPYAIRIVSEILSSNGSSSMASVCGSSLALMDAGVPIKTPAAGIAMGLMMEDENHYKILTDIQGPEDHYGDMDFKVAGTKNGITGVQMDVKIKGITLKIFEETLLQAKKARLEILKKIEEVIAQPRPTLSPYAPKIFTIQIDPDKIRDVIGSGGKTINDIIKKTGVEIDIEEDGQIFITAPTEEAGKEAIQIIQNITHEFKEGEIVTGKVSRILDFGAIVDLGFNREGLLHISEIANRRINKVGDEVKVGQVLTLKIIKIDENGRIALSLKALHPEEGSQKNKKQVSQKTFKQKR